VTDIDGMCNSAWRIPCMSEREKLVQIGLPCDMIQGHALLNNMTEKRKFLDCMSKQWQFKEESNYWTSLRAEPPPSSRAIADSRSFPSSWIIYESNLLLIGLQSLSQML